MIQKLRIRFIITSMLALLLVLIIIMGLINIFNYRGIISDANRTLTILSDNNGTFPKKNEEAKADSQSLLPTPPEPAEGERIPLSPELPYESRYFSVLLSESGDIISVDTGKIAAIDTQTAIALGKEIHSNSKACGFSGNYRYMKSEDEELNERIIFLDCTRSLATFRNFLITSGIISCLGFLSVFILILIFSKRVIQPFAQGYEKQKRFITDAGHELKTPMTIINADIDILEMESDDNEWLKDIRLQTSRLTQLTNDLILLSKMEEDQPPLTMIDFPLSDLISETLQSFSALARAQEKKLTADIEPALSFHGDDKALRQLVVILLDNALKYSADHSEIHISLSKHKKTVCLLIRNTTDTCIPSPPDMLFERFYRADPSRNRTTGGNGLGLSIARRIVDTHKGKISASVQENSVLTIKISLPLS